MLKKGDFLAKKGHGQKYFLGASPPDPLPFFPPRGYGPEIFPARTALAIGVEQASEQVENPYWRAVLSDIEAYLKYQSLKMVRVVAN